MILLRELDEKDAPFMLEWMHDPDTQSGFKKNMLNKTIDDAVSFCRRERIPSNVNDGANIHYAIVDQTDEYLGTVSLKNIDLLNNSAEYAIVLRTKAKGNGIAYAATKLVLEAAFVEYGLHRVYLTVFASNIAAIKLYERCGFSLEGELREHLYIDGKYVDWRIYGILESEFGR